MSEEFGIDFHRVGLVSLAVGIYLRNSFRKRSTFNVQRSGLDHPPLFEKSWIDTRRRIVSHFLESTACTGMELPKFLKSLKVQTTFLAFVTSIN